ncbi:DUF6176 family protein [Caldimonas sp. KR1-144]|uniref:DUF6176 family protein n=1 Tax=Caldimonas sp. KR1-144 TaxID=3400911 RepID=UPI003C0F5F0E
MPPKTELVTFAIKPGKEARAEEWMRMLVERRDECIATLAREQMHYESIFRLWRDGRLYLTWFSVQGEAGERVEGSPFEVDRLHMAFWRECIDDEVPPTAHEHVVRFVPGPMGS